MLVRLLSLSGEVYAFWMPSVSAVKDVSFELLRRLGLGGGVSVKLMMAEREWSGRQAFVLERNEVIATYCGENRIFEATYMLSPLICPLCCEVVARLNFCDGCTYGNPLFCDSRRCFEEHWGCRWDKWERGLEHRDCGERKEVRRRRTAG